MLFTRTTKRDAAHAATIRALAIAEERAYRAQAALDELVRAVDQVKTSSHLSAAAVARHTRGLSGDLNVRAPHLQDPRLAAAMKQAATVLGHPLRFP